MKKKKKNMHDGKLFTVKAKSFARIQLTHINI